MSKIEVSSSPPIQGPTGDPGQKPLPEHSTHNFSKGAGKKMPDLGVNAQEEQALDQEKASKELIEQTVKRINSHIQKVERNLQFEVDEDTGRTVVKVMDTQTQELIRQIPREEILKLAQTLHKRLQIIDIKV